MTRLEVEEAVDRYGQALDASPTNGVEAGVLDPHEPALAERTAGLRGIHEQAQVDAEEARFRPGCGYVVLLVIGVLVYVLWCRGEPFWPLRPSWWALHSGSCGNTHGPHESTGLMTGTEVRRVRRRPRWLFCL
jgi:hypothetical protein